jgi:hypothetical protein
MKLKYFIQLFFLISVICSSEVQANYTLYQGDQGLDLGEEYTDFSKSTSPKSASTKSKKEDRSFFVSALLYIPNRVLDILDIFRFDVGVGPAVGAVVRVTPHAQAGMRLLMPVSLRAGLRGRKSPVFVEHTSEMGVGPLYLDSAQREPTPLEIGAGVDLFLVGFYLGISVDSIFDAVLGFVGIDISDDDL